MDTIDKGMSHVQGRMEREGEAFHHTTQKGAQFKTYEGFYFWNFLFNIFGLQLTSKNKTTDGVVVNTGLIFPIAYYLAIVSPDFRQRLTELIISS